MTDLQAMLLALAAFCLGVAVSFGLLNRLYKRLVVQWLSDTGAFPAILESEFATLRQQWARKERGDAA